MEEDELVAEIETDKVYFRIWFYLLIVIDDSHSEFIKFTLFMKSFPIPKLSFLLRRPYILSLNMLKLEFNALMNRILDNGGSASDTSRYNRGTFGARWRKGYFLALVIFFLAIFLFGSLAVTSVVEKQASKILRDVAQR